MKKVAYIIFIFIVFIIVILNILTVFDYSLCGFRIYRIVSGSMTPYIKVNDIILIKNSGKYEIGDVVTYKNKYGEYVTHRIVQINDSKFTAKGDANNVEDENLDINNIIGKVIFKTSAFSIIIGLFNNYILWIILFILGNLIIYFISERKKVNK